MLRLKQVLMKRDNLSASEADARIEEAKNALMEYLDAGDLTSADNVCEEFFGLEPDYLMDLM